MAFNFDESIDRRHSDSYKWQKYYERDVIPLWVADTDFRSPDCIIEALHGRVEHGVFGYGATPQELVSLFIQRMESRYQWKVKPEWLVFLPGLVSGLNLAARSMSGQNNALVMPSPVYPPFRSAAHNAGHRQRLAPMTLCGQRWKVDLAAIEADMDGSERMLTLCNPHNPGGTVYNREELLAQLAFARRHDLLVCSDEIHCDLLLEPGARHIPIASLGEDAEQRTITLMSPSKTFNIAGLGASLAVIPNGRLRMQFAALRNGVVPNVDVLAYTAATAAWRDGQPWLDELLVYLRSNRDWLAERINRLPGLSMVSPEATYLAWIDASRLGLDNPQRFFEQAGVGLSGGTEFGNPQFVRLNFGCTRALLEEAVSRMERAVNTLG